MQNFERPFLSISVNLDGVLAITDRRTETQKSSAYDELIRSYAVASLRSATPYYLLTFIIKPLINIYCLLYRFGSTCLWRPNSGCNNLRHQSRHSVHENEFFPNAY